jgi:unsaturated rhamnogalacturonyl hydrolase
VSAKLGSEELTGFVFVLSNGLVDIYSACDGVGVQSSYDRYINYKRSINAKEAVAGFLWATKIRERPPLTKLKSLR